MSERRIDVFFYGLFMDGELLRGKGVEPNNPRPASLEHFGLRIGRRATLVPARNERSYGVVMGLTSGELQTLYRAPGLEQYQAEAVGCTLLNGGQVCALCYNLPDAPSPGEANEEYAGQLRGVLTRLGFPAEYVAKVR